MLGYNDPVRAVAERHPDDVPPPRSATPIPTTAARADGAGQRITDLTQAKRILLAEV